MRTLKTDITDPKARGQEGPWEAGPWEAAPCCPLACCPWGGWAAGDPGALLLGVVSLLQTAWVLVLSVLLLECIVLLYSDRCPQNPRKA